MTQTDRPAPPTHLAANLSAYLALFGGALAMAFSPILVRLADVGPFASAFFRVLLALPVLYAWMRVEDAQGEDVPDLAPKFSLPVLATGLFFAGDLFFWHLAILNTTVANATFFATTAPVWVALFGWLIYHQRPGLLSVAGLAFCLVGGGALVSESFAFAPERLLGDALAIITAIFFGAYFIGVEKARLRHRAAHVTFYASLVTATALGVVALLATLILDQKFWPGNWQGWLVLLGLGIVCHAGGQGLLAVALGSLPVMFSALVIFLEAVAAAFFGWLFLSEAVTGWQALGGFIILLGIWTARPRGVLA